MGSTVSDFFFTSDTHFGHSGILKLSNRPFPSIEDMDQSIIDNINSRVKSNDILYFLGDFCYWKFSNEKYAEILTEYRRQIHCKNIHFIYGNHDKRLKSNFVLQHQFSSCQDYLEIKIGKKELVLFHYALRTWYHSQYRSFALGGHSHQGLPDDPSLLWMDVGIDFNFFPFSLDEVKERMRLKDPIALDHHEIVPYKTRKPKPIQMKLPCLVSGTDLRSLGLNPGPIFGQIIKSIQKMQIENPLLTKEEALSWIKKIQIPTYPFV